jgi:adenylate/nucleoside-diphosphate kinase
VGESNDLNTTKSIYNIEEHLRKLHSEWQNLKKSVNRPSPKNILNRQKFQDSLDQDLFDIAHQDAMSLIKIAEDRSFLEAQREKGRRGTLGGVNKISVQREQRAEKRRAEMEKRAEKARSESAILTTFADADIDELPIGIRLSELGRDQNHLVRNH